MTTVLHPKLQMLCNNNNNNNITNNSKFQRMKPSCATSLRFSQVVLAQVVSSIVELLCTQLTAGTTGGWQTHSLTTVSSFKKTEWSS